MIGEVLGKCVEELRAIVSYSKESGEIVWLKKLGARTTIGEVAGSVAADGYLHVVIKGKVWKQHRLAYLLVTGNLPPDQVDHINGDRADNRWSNLRCVSNSENGKNVKLPTTSTSGVIGVSWHTRDLKWVAYITVQGERKSLGYYTNKGAAINARRAAEVEYGFHENHGRDT